MTGIEDLKDPKHWELNEHGLWCAVCGELIAAPWNIDEEYEPPECCPNCGWPDEFDPEAI